jgi:hypothetical protein
MPLLSTPEKPINFVNKNKTVVRQKKVDQQKYNENWDKIFGNKEKR